MQINAITTIQVYKPQETSAGVENGSEPTTQTEKTATSPIEKQQALGDPNSEEAIELRKLQVRDREVRAHEQAHLAAAGRFATGGASFEFQRGPDGRSYAIGGEVRIDTSAIPGDPRATLEKAETIRRAATAPANPSSQDRQVAAAAVSMAAEARAELQVERSENSGPTAASDEESPQTGEEHLQQRLTESGAVATAEPVTLMDLFA